MISACAAGLRDECQIHIQEASAETEGADVIRLQRDAVF